MSDDAEIPGDDDVAGAAGPDRCLWCRLGVGCARHAGSAVPDAPVDQDDHDSGPAGPERTAGPADRRQLVPALRPVGAVPGRVGGRPVGAVLSESEEGAGLLAHAAPDGELLGLLLAVEPDEVDDYTAVEVVAAFRRVEAAAAAGAARAAAALAGRDSMHGRMPTRRGVSDVDLAADELGMRLGVTRQEAGKLVDLGQAFTGVLAPTGDALAAGLIDARKARMIATALSGRPGPVAWGVQDTVLPTAPRRTHPQLQRDLNAALVAADPPDAHDRQRRAAAARKATHLRPGRDGTATMLLDGPAHELIVLDATLQAAAVAARAAGDARTTDQLRFDAAVAMAAGAFAAGRIGEAPGPGGPTGPFALSDKITVNLTVPLAVALPPDLPATGVLVGTAAQRSQGAAACGTGAEPDAGASPGPAGTGSPGDSGGPPGGTWGSAFFPPAPDGDPLDTYGDEPDGPIAHLDGVGPITHEAARALALGGTWRRVVVDPFTDTVLDVGRTTYRPPADMARLVRERDRTCIAPGCTVPARHCQLDHSVSWASGGHTAVYNLAPMCEHDHPRKTCGAFHVEQPQPGTFIWTTPSGHRYRRTPDGHVTTLPRHEHPDDEPPF
ncbi:uncharacterized protein DUF222 [Georgenia soli]|uniref:Uncharacterized protein DUF222 n=1 Tax=Georgenia soli TaxID=638953 RepID=A0A2A9EIH1_9MICO|nr:HNH endonuclease signature motif containing protein [Georgenia soli]PFG38877.1 uncharacterized protein DUF222 [Georgenia soli]